MYLIGAASSAGAATMIVFSIAPFSLGFFSSAAVEHPLPDQDVDAIDHVLVVDRTLTTRS